MDSYDVVLDRPSLDQVLLNDPLDDIDSAGVVPRTFGIDDCYWALRADLKTVRLRSIDTTVSGQIQLLEPALQVFPRLEAEFFV